MPGGAPYGTLAVGLYVHERNRRRCKARQADTERLARALPVVLFAPPGGQGLRARPHRRPSTAPRSTLRAYAEVGLGLPHFSGAQLRLGIPVLPDALRPADLLAYGPDGSEHVALYIGGGLSVEARGVDSGVVVAPARVTGERFGTAPRGVGACDRSASVVVGDRDRRRPQTGGPPVAGSAWNRALATDGRQLDREASPPAGCGERAARLGRRRRPPPSSARADAPSPCRPGAVR
jgi:hypothetical protein